MQPHVAFNLICVYSIDQSINQSKLQSIIYFNTLNQRAKKPIQNTIMYNVLFSVQVHNFSNPVVS